MQFQNKANYQLFLPRLAKDERDSKLHFRALNPTDYWMTLAALLMSGSTLMPNSLAVLRLKTTWY